MDWHRDGRTSFPNALFSRGRETKTGPDVCRVRGWAIALADGFWSQEVLSALHIFLFKFLFLQYGPVCVPCFITGEINTRSRLKIPHPSIFGFGLWNA